MLLNSPLHLMWAIRDHHLILLYFHTCFRSPVLYRV
jgi:hypothetical protein